MNLYALIASLLSGIVIYAVLNNVVGIPNPAEGVGIWLLSSTVLYFLLDRILTGKAAFEHTEGKIVKELAKCGVLEIPIEKLSSVWQERGKFELEIDKLVKNWRDERKIEMERKYEQIKNDRVRQFHEFVKSRIEKLYRYTDEKTGQETINYPDTYYVEFNIIQSLLVKLDKEGGCPSVVSPKNRGAEPDSLKEEENPLVMLSENINTTNSGNSRGEISTWKLLKGVSLLEHSLHVANNIIRLTAEKYPENEALYLVDAVIVALAHDVGKILPEYESAIEPHPVISARILERMLKNISFEKKEKTEEGKIEIKQIKLSSPKVNTLVRVVRDHHKKSRAVQDSEKKDMSMSVSQYEALLELLKEADHKARKEEVEEMMRIIGMAGISDDQASLVVDLQNKSKQMKNKIAELTPPPEKGESRKLSIPKPDPYLYPEFEETTAGIKEIPMKEKEEFKLEEIKCEWLDDSFEDILRVIESRINLVKIINDKPVYEIFSVKDTVFVVGLMLIKLVWFFAKKNNDDEMQRLILINSNYRRGAALLLVDELRKASYLKVSEIKKGYFGGFFTIESKRFNEDKSNVVKGFYTPLNLQTFANNYTYGNIGIYEARKKSKEWDSAGILKTFVGYRIGK